jgi:hypothetical protein
MDGPAFDEWFVANIVPEYEQMPSGLFVWIQHRDHFDITDVVKSIGKLNVPVPIMARAIAGTARGHDACYVTTRAAHCTLEHPEDQLLSEDIITVTNPTLYGFLVWHVALTGVRHEFITQTGDVLLLKEAETLIEHQDPDEITHALTHLLLAPGN